MQFNSTLLFICLSLLTPNNIQSQNEIGEIGSHWNYSYNEHTGNGGGWDMIVVERDTIINGEVHKILRHDFFWKPTYSTNPIYGSNILGTLIERSDSIFINDNLIMDFTMEIGDTMVYEVDSDNKILLIADSITTKIIDNLDYKKWHLQKLCFTEEYLADQSQVEIIEGIGQIGNEYLLWNLDVCVFIGGGTYEFDCYRNGDFVYPPGSDCEQLVDTAEIPSDQISIYPNPTVEKLIVTSDEMIFDQIKLYNLMGEVIFSKTENHLSRNQFDTSVLPSGMYFLELSPKNKYQKTIKTIIKK